MSPSPAPEPDALTWMWDGTEFVSPAHLPVTDRACRYGMALFETIRLTPSGPVQWEEHLTLLRASAKAVGFAFPAACLGALDEIAAAHLRFPGVARLFLTAGDGGPLDAAPGARLFVLAEGRPEPDLTPVRVICSDIPFAPAPGGLKTANYWANLRALASARDVGAGEALLFGPARDLVSAAMANVFLMLDGELVTPPVSSGARPGTVRAWILKNHPVSERPVSRERFADAEELFLTNSGYGVRPAFLNQSPARHAMADRLGREYAAAFLA